MMFEQDLRSYLERLERNATSATAVAWRPVAVEDLRAHLLNRLRTLEATPRWVARAHREWMPKLDRLAIYIARLDRASAPVDATGAREFACRVLDQLIDPFNSDLDLALVDRLEADRIAKGFEEGSSVVETYALETRLVRRTEGTGVAITALGRIFLRLRGKDALRWLLTAEVLQSTGDFDPWRASSQLLRESLSDAGILLDSDGGFLEEVDFPFSNTSLERLNRLGVLMAHDRGDGEAVKYWVPDTMRDIVREALEPGPWHAGMRALMDDESANVFGGEPSRATDATIEQTRMIAHEVRNALVPVRHHIDHMLGGLPSPPEGPRLDAVRRGVVRVLDFVDEMVATSELLSEPATTFGLPELVHETLEWIDGAEQVAVRAEAVQVRAPRSQLSRALANLVENALRAAPIPTTVRLTARRTGRVARLEIDDAGPGVALELRSRIFDDGFTTRPGGSGFGLFFVRRVVERDLGGKVWCEDSDLGGARFVIEIAATEPTP